MLVKKYLKLFTVGMIVILIVDTAVNSFEFTNILAGSIMIGIIPYLMICIFCALYERTKNKRGKEFVLWPFFLIILLSYIVYDIFFFGILDKTLTVKEPYLYAGIYAALIYGVLSGIIQRGEKTAGINHSKINNENNTENKNQLEKENKSFLNISYIFEPVLAASCALLIINYKMIYLFFKHMYN